MADESLRDQLLALPGVADVEVDGDDDAPAALRVRVSPGADGAAVGAEVQRVLAGRGMRSRVGEGDTPAPLFDDVGPAAGDPAAEAPARLESVTIEETAAGARVTVAASDGRRASRSAAAGDRALEEAVVGAVGELVDGEGPRLLSLEWKLMEGAEVATLVLAGKKGTGAGAAVARATRAFAVARAAWSALAD